jgi:hypothetical protein
VVSWPGVTWEYESQLPDVFFALLIAATLPALAHRLRQAWRLGRQADADSRLGKR